MVDGIRAGASVLQKTARRVTEYRELFEDYVKIGRIVVRMSEEERADFFDWWFHSRHEEKTAVAEVKRGFRDIARKIGM